jgi:Tol biopolymer transport system component
MPAFGPRSRIQVLLMTVLVAGCSGTAVGPTTSPTLGTSKPSAEPGAATPPGSAPPSPAPSGSQEAGLKGQIVFEDSGEGFHHTQIWLENADGSNVRQLVKDAFTDNSASLSPDGSRIVFGRGFTDSIEDAVADPSLFGAIMVVNVDGTGLHEVETGSRAKLCDAAPEGDAWSPDGRRIAYVRYCFDPKAQFVEMGIWTINADGSDARRVTRTEPAAQTQDHRVGWSPDGKSLTFNRIDTSVSPERDAIFTIGVDGKGLHQVTPWSLGANDPDWSPDGTLIAFNASAEPSPTQNIYTIHADGTGLTELTRYDESGQATFHPSWSPDGSQILFSHSPSTDGWGDFFVMNRDGSDQHVVAKTDLHENHGTWGSSPTP